MTSDQLQLHSPTPRQRKWAAWLAVAGLALLLLLLTAIAVVSFGRRGPFTGNSAAYGSVLTHPGLTLAERAEYLLPVARTPGGLSSKRPCFACHGQ